MKEAIVENKRQIAAGASVNLADSTSPVCPTNMLVAIDAIQEVCGTMFGTTVEPRGAPEKFTAQSMGFGVCISLVRAAGSWELGIFGTKKDSLAMGRLLLGMEDEEEPATDEVVDLLGEIVNIVSGMVKRSARDAGDIQFGVPLPLLDEDCTTYVPQAIPIVAQRFYGADFDGELLLVWHERNPTALASEVAAVLGEAEVGDARAIAAGVALLEELMECAEGARRENIVAACTSCEHTLMSIINDELAEPVDALNWVRARIDSLSTALTNRQVHLFQPEPAPQFTPRGASSNEIKPQTTVERDEDTLETLTDFLQESDEGLDLADQTLLKLESGTQGKDDIDALFRVFHSIKGLSSFLDIDEVTALAHTTETLLSQARDGKLALVGVPLDVVFEATDLMRQQMAAVRSAVEEKLSFPGTPSLSAQIARLEAAVEGAPLPEPASPADQPVMSRADPPPKVQGTVKIGVDLVARLAKATEELSVLSKEENPLSNLTHISSELSEIAALMQMVSVSTLFGKMTRMVRDLSKKTSKLARLVIDGEETLIARTILEKLGDPLVHMIRNAVDHGVEDAEDRRSAGKPPMGTIQLSAYYEGHSQTKRIVIELKDDGKGLDAEMLVKKAISKGILEPESTPSEAEAFQLIFAAGFSTAAAVTAISGRGVGMDVVRRNIENLGGEIVIASTVGKGSSFKISLPWTA